MKRLTILVVTVLAFIFMMSSTSAYAQDTFKMSFKFEAGGKKFPAGEYWVSQKGDEQITLRHASTGKEVQIPFLKKLEKPEKPVEEPQLVFYMVGNFEPSYTEYVTEYILAEVWLPGKDGLLVHTLKGAHKTQIIKGQKAKK
ncbi:MAG: hypothetical protein ABIL68_02685 [bacterium]